MNSAFGSRGLLRAGALALGLLLISGKTSHAQGGVGNCGGGGMGNFGGGVGNFGGGLGMIGGGMGGLGYRGEWSTLPRVERPVPAH
jgi:hypothetical protein